MAISQERRVRALDKHLKALDMRRQGYSYRQIAEACGYKDRPGAFMAVQRALKNVLQEAAEPLAKLEGERLDAALQTAVTIAEDAGQKPEVRLQAIDRIVRIMERRAKLLGLDAPTAIVTDQVTKVIVEFADSSDSETDAVAGDDPA